MPLDVGVEDAYDKLTHAGIYGVDKSMETLENLYGIDISYYVKVNFTSVVEIVDALGGVDVDSPYEFSTSKYHFNQGVNHADPTAAYHPQQQVRQENEPDVELPFQNGEHDIGKRHIQTA